VILYLHGFNSSPRSHKAQLLGRYLAGRGLAADYDCPALPPLASDALREIERRLPQENLCFVGSSLGGFYATYLAERYARSPTWGSIAGLISTAFAAYFSAR